jgi:hypothetical protein
MIITQKVIRPNGTVEIIDIEVDDNYYGAPPTESPTAEDRLTAIEDVLLGIMLGL